MIPPTPTSQLSQQGALENESVDPLREAAWLPFAANGDRLKSAQGSVQDLCAFQQAILDSAPFSAIATDPCGAIVWVNRTAEEWLGYTAHELIGRVSPIIFHDPEELAARAAELATELGMPVERDFNVLIGRCEENDAAVEREWSYLRKDGSRFPIALSVRVLRGGDQQRLGFVCVGQDISVRKVADQRHAEALRKLRDAYKLKSSFLANVSHEIRTPMNGILGMAELLARTGLPAIQQYYVDNIRECGEALLVIINDVLDISKIESGKLTFERTAFDLFETIGKTVEVISPTAEKKGIPVVLSFSPDVPTLVLGDPGRLRQILTNLVGNAIKFTDKGSVTVRVSSADSANTPSLLRFEVKDTGIGISPEAKAKLFQPFVQADASTSRRFGGTGLGLSIAQQLTVLMGGEMGVESAVGVGSLFWFTLPLPETTAGRQGTPMRKLRMLVADDNPLNQRVAAGMLNSLGHTVDVVATGVEAVEAAKTSQYDLIFMDCQMPEMDGYSASRAIRALRGDYPQLADIPIIALTAYVDEETRAKCFEAGMSGYQSKPLRIAELHALLAPYTAAEPSKQDSIEIQERCSFADFPILDRAKLNELRTIEISGQPNIFQKLLNLFFSEGLPLYSALLSSMEAGDANSAMTHAHKLAGSCGNFGGLRVMRICLAIENRAKSGDLAGAVSLTKALKGAFEEFCSLLRKEFDLITEW
ncbi:MAG: ATP-binding protein [Verrucomicrobiota bacterium]